MIIILAIIGALIGLAVLIWLAAFLYLNDFSVPRPRLSRFRRVLVVFPHPDDEVLTAGGFLQILPPGTKTTLLLLTKGERGTPDAHLDPDLKKIRSDEEKRVQEILGIDRLIHLDYGDGQLSAKKKEIAVPIAETIEEEKPDLVITYDLSGLYGHDDHIAVSEAVTGLIKNKYRSISLWYASIPPRVLALTRLPVHMATDKDFIKKRTVPDLKVFIGLKVIGKINALYAHKSQLPSYQKGVPLRIPLRFYYSITLFEYFYKAN